MGSQYQNAFKKSATAAQPVANVLTCADILKIFQLENPYLYDHPKDEKISDLSCFVNILMHKASINPEKPEINKITTKINPDKSFLVAACYTTSSQESIEPEEHFALFIGTFRQKNAEDDAPLILYPDLHYVFNTDLRQNKVLDQITSIWKDISDDGTTHYHAIDNAGKVYASLCYANELFVRIITGQDLDDDSIKAAQAWFKKSLEEKAVQIGICLDRQPNAIFNAGAQIVYRQQMGERPQDIYPTPERKQ